MKREQDKSWSNTTFAKKKSKIRCYRQKRRSNFFLAWAIQHEKLSYLLTTHG